MMKTMQCDGCLDWHVPEALTECGSGWRICPRCGFVFFLYEKMGHPKQPTERGCFAPFRVASNIRKIVAEFDRDPRGTMLKYIGKEMRTADDMDGIFEVCETEFGRLKNGWPFVLLSEEQAAHFKPEVGKSVEAYHGKERIQRVIAAIRRFADGEGMRYRRGAFTALFVPAEGASRQ